MYWKKIKAREQGEMDNMPIMQMAGSAQPVQRRGISGSTLKIIAIIAMLIDHIGAVVVLGFLQHAWYGKRLVTLYYVMRLLIGRIAFPIFCFLLVEGFAHTRNVKKYALRLLGFALISELPFNLAFEGKLFAPQYQNVFFTLFIGLLVMIGYRAVTEKLAADKWMKLILYAALLGAGVGVAFLLKTDYDAIGVFCIMALYIFRRNKTAQIMAGCAGFLASCFFTGGSEMTAPLAFIPIGFYNGKRGLKMKYFFYLFYPVHLLVLYFIAYFLGLI